MAMKESNEGRNLMPGCLRKRKRNMLGELGTELIMGLTEIFVCIEGLVVYGS